MHKKPLTYLYFPLFLLLLQAPGYTAPLSTDTVLAATAVFNTGDSGTSTAHGGIATVKEEPREYPVLIHEIEKSRANYKTPENTASATNSAILQRDVDWYFQTLTQKTAEYEKGIYQKAGIDLSAIFQSTSPTDEIYLTGKIPYKDGIILTFEGHLHDIDGTIIKSHSAYILENLLWKRTSKFSGDEELDQYDDVLYTSCIAGYRFGPDFLEDSCWHGNDLTNYNKTEIALDKRYNEDLTAAVFNGIDSGLFRTHLNDMPIDRLSMGGWIKADKIAHPAGIIEIGRDSDDSTAIVLVPGRGLRCWVHTVGGRVEGTAVLDQDLHDNQWHHVYLTYDGAKMELYVDGQLKDSRPAAGPIDSTPVLNIGIRQFAGGEGAGHAFKGRLDDIQIYNKALNADEILKKYKNGTTQSL